MAFKILKQFNVQSSTVWVDKLTDNDTVDTFETEQEALDFKITLETSDSTDRLYKVVEI
jgi:hypothetical protein|tara:strand:- start:276 stop:452 length:177 start_codon:yes stop_codon:yes gene_type:complete